LLGLLLALQLARVGASVNKHFQALRFGAGLIERPVGHGADIHAQGIPVQAGLESVGFAPRRCRAQGKGRRFGVPQKRLRFARRAGEGVNTPGSQSNAVRHICRQSVGNL